MLLRRQLEALLHGAKGDHVSFRTHFHGKAINDGQGEWQADGEGGPLAFAAFHQNCAAQGVYVSTHYIQTYAAAGEFRHLVRSRKARLKDEVVNLGFGETDTIGNNSLCPRVLENALVIEPRPIVGDLHDDVAGVVERLQDDLAAGVLSQGAADIRRL